MDNITEMVEKHNIGVASAQAGATVATSIIIAASAGGVSTSWADGFTATLLFWAIGQALLLLYALAVDGITSLPVVQAFSTRLVRRPDGAEAPTETDSEESMDIGPTSMLRQACAMREAPCDILMPHSPQPVLPEAPYADVAYTCPPAFVPSPCVWHALMPPSDAHARVLVHTRSPHAPRQAAGGNVAAGLNLGADMVHAALVIAAPINVGWSLVAWLIFVVTALLVVTPLLHLYLDHIVMRGAAYSVNILHHKNWGAAVLLGSLKVPTPRMSRRQLVLLRPVCLPPPCRPSANHGPIAPFSAAGAHRSRAPVALQPKLLRRKRRRLLRLRTAASGQLDGTSQLRCSP